jgi:hypothetical protein
MNQPTTLRNALQILGGLEIGLFLLCWLALCIVAFFMINAWGVEHDRRMAAIESGEIRPDTLRVSRFHQMKANDYLAVFVNEAGEEIATRKVTDPPAMPVLPTRRGDLRVGDDVVAYRFGEEYLIPNLDGGGHYWGKWVFLALGLLPIPVIGGIAFSRKWLQRRR